MTTLAFSRGWSRTAAASHPILFAALVVTRRVRRHFRVRRDQRRLQAMPDYLLADLGISRGQIEAATALGRDHLINSAKWR